ILFCHFREHVEKLMPGSSLNSIFILLQVYVLGFIILGLSGAYDLLSKTEWGLKMIKTVEMKGAENLQDLETAFTKDQPPEYTDLPKSALDSKEPYEWAKAYIYLKDRDGVREIDQL